MKTNKFDCRTCLKKYGTITILIVMCVALTIISPRFLQVRNLMNIVKQISIYAIIGCGMTMVVITSGIDLSAGAMVAVSSMAVDTFAVKMGLPMIAAIILTLVIGALIGLFNGSMVAFFDLPPLSQPSTPSSHCGASPSSSAISRSPASPRLSLYLVRVLSARFPYSLSSC